MKLQPDRTQSIESLLAERHRLIGNNLRLSYDTPLHIVRGSMQYLYDVDGRKYCDAYNNVSHVGHCHPRVVQVGSRQMAKLNANTRYLQEGLGEYAANLTASLPPPLRRCFFVNSGSEANELALRLARTHTHQKDVIVLDYAYHGNTTTLVDISPYKHNGPGGEGRPHWVHTAPLPDLYRGPYKYNDIDAGIKYANCIISIVERLHESGVKPAAFVAESWPSVAGQMSLPSGFLASVYSTVRAAGGVCISDEIQTAYGRLGSWFWGFEAYGVIPDIITLGKPIGNGHPLGAVVTTPEIAASFDNGMEFFSSFGGSTVSCAIGHEVLKIVQEKNLMEHAAHVGGHLLARLQDIKKRHPIVGDVRGSGLYVGVELVRDRETLEPATGEARSVVNQMRKEGVLLGTDGVHHNVLKIRPPMPFTSQNANLLADVLETELSRVHGVAC